MPCQQSGLQVGDKGPGYSPPEEWMRYLLLLPLLVAGEEISSSRLAERHPACRLCLEVAFRDLVSIHERENEAIGKWRPQFLHEIQRERWAPRSVAMKKARVGIESNARERRGAIVEQDGICKREQRIDRVPRRPTAPLAK